MKRSVQAFYLPGCLVGGVLLDRLGRRRTQYALQHLTNPLKLIERQIRRLLVQGPFSPKEET